MHTVKGNPPVTAAAIAAAIGGLLAAFTELDIEQLGAINAVVVIVAAVIAQRWTVPYQGPDGGFGEGVPVD